MRRLRPSVVLLTGFLLAAHAAFGQAGPISGTAKVLITTSATTLRPAQPLTVTVAVDLSGVTGTNGGARTPAVLGAYQIRLVFDPSRLRFDAAAGGTSPQFTFEPISTEITRANADGKTTIVGSQTDGSAPTGYVSVARLTFSAIGAGSTSIVVEPLSLSTAFQLPGYGPVLLPFTGSSKSIVIGEPSDPNDPNSPGGEPKLGRRHPVRNPRFHPGEGASAPVTIVTEDGVATIRIAMLDRSGEVLDERLVDVGSHERRTIDPRSVFPPPWPDDAEVTIEVAWGTATIER